jgi:hypothetical protein
MITSFFLNAVFLFIRVILSPLRLAPDVSLPSDVLNAVSTANEYISSLSLFIPVYTILTILFLVLSIEGFIFAYKILMWVIRRLPTQS